jgi:hypothetical protein
MSAGLAMTMSVVSAFPAHCLRNGLVISLIYDLHEPSVSSSLGHWVSTAVNLLLRHITSILLTRTKVYGYNVQQLNNGIINSTTRFHLHGCLYQIYITTHGSMNIY